jgi:thiol-disulfide isomerase/thioredoxin
MKKMLLLFFVSFFVCICLMPIGGFIGHHIKFIITAPLYFVSTFLIFRKNDFFRSRYSTTLFLILLPPTILYLPLHLINFQETKISLPSTIAHYIGAITGYFAFKLDPVKRTAITLAFLTFCGWFVYWGNNAWVHKINFNTYSSNIKFQTPAHLIAVNENLDPINSDSLRNKIVVLDFWHSRCGACFTKFPELQKLYDNYKKDNSIVIYAVNMPLKTDSVGQASSMLKKRDYTFPVLIDRVNSFTKAFNVITFPTTIIIDKKGSVIFKGPIDNASSIIEELLKSQAPSINKSI